ncbi:MAG: hypothetical protein H7328_07975 [Bdellovibrio sp.]|nr:hypothetical protein [Bdellovibrio sp.]
MKKAVSFLVSVFLFSGCGKVSLSSALAIDPAPSAASPIVPSISYGQFADIPANRLHSGPFCFQKLNNAAVYYREYFTKISQSRFVREEDLYTGSDCLSGIYATAKKTYEVLSFAVYQPDPVMDLVSVKSISLQVRYYNQSDVDNLNLNCSSGGGYGHCGWNTTNFVDISNQTLAVDDAFGPIDAANLDLPLYYNSGTVIELDSSTFQ